MFISKNIINKLYNKKNYIICILSIIVLFIIIYLLYFRINENFVNQSISPATYAAGVADTWIVPP